MAQDAQVSLVLSRQRKLRSVVWNDFTKVIKEDGSDLASCNYCKKYLSGASRCGTTHLRNHLKYCLSYQQANRERANSLQVIPREMVDKEEDVAIMINEEGSDALTSHVPQIPRQGKLRSLVWNDFTKEKKADGSILAICNHCKKQMAGSSNCGTTHLRKHLLSCLLYRKTKRRKIDIRTLIQKSHEQKNVDTAGIGIHVTPIRELMDHDNVAHECSQFDQETSQQDLARMVILHEYPFSIVNHVGFRTFVKNLQPQFRLMSHTSLEEYCMKIYEEKRENLSDVLGSLSCRVCLMVDMCNLRGNMDYLWMGCHFISDDWKLEKKLINFIPIESPLDVEKIAKLIVEKLCEWNIDRKLFCVILGNSSTSDSVVQELLHCQPKGSLPLNGDLFHVRCCSHVLNLIVQDGLEQISESINKIRDSIKFVMSSQTKLEIFWAIAKQVGSPEKTLIIDLPSSWKSTYIMMETACEFQDAFSGLEEVDCEFTCAPSHMDWDNVLSVNECLRVFYDMTEKYSHCKLPTASICFNDICGILMSLKTWSASPYLVVVSVAAKMLEQFQKYWDVNSTILAAASILDPRYRMKSVEYFFKLIYTETAEAEMKISSVLRDFTNAYNGYAVQSGKSSGCEGLTDGQSTGTHGPSGQMGVDQVSRMPHSKLTDLHFGLDRYLQENSSDPSVKSDLDVYLEEAVLPPIKGHTSFDVLAWWNQNAAKYPILCLMARDILAIPLTISMLESCFSGARKEINNYQSSMNPTTLQGLVCAQDWLSSEMADFSVAGLFDGLSTMSATDYFCGEMEACV